MPEPISLAIAIGFIVKNAPAWLDSIRSTLLNKGKDYAIEKGMGYGRSLLRLDEKEQIRHLELALKNAAERGIAKFSELEKRDQYRDVLAILSEPSSHSEDLRREALRLFTLSDTPNLTELNETYNRSLRIRSLSDPTPPAEVDAAAYLSSFFEALIAELYIDPFFKQQMSDVLQLRAATSMQRSLAEIVTSLRHIGEVLADHYTLEQFEQDVEVYTDHIERTFHYLKLIGVVPKDLGDRNADPELNGIFVPLRVALLQGTATTSKEENKQTSIIDVLEQKHYVVLLGGPGIGKSTAIRYLAWSHAVANQSSSSVSDASLLSGDPLPLRIELRRLNEDRKQQPDYNFLSYATRVLLGREGVEINPQMFKELLERRTMLLLFDGLDEVSTLAERRQLIEEIENFAQNYPGNRILVTSRPVGYELTRFSNQWFSHAKVQDFNDEQIRQFLERWYTHVLRLSPIPQDDQRELETLYTTLQNNPHLHTLAANPLLLTVITALHRYERLPDRRAQVYDRCAELLLEKWAKLRGTDVRWKDMKMVKDDQHACVAYLGFILHERSQEQETAGENAATDITARFILREIERFLNSRKLITEVAERRAEAQHFLELMQEEAGLIVERGTDEGGEPLYGFVHRTFQEYFAAANIYEQYQQEEDPTIVTDFLTEHLHDPHWHEVILLLLGKLKRKPVTAQLRQILEGRVKSRRSQYTDIVQQDLFFVSSCLIEEIPVENDLEGSVISHLSNLVKNSPFPLQRERALQYLGSLVQTRQYGNLARGELINLVTTDSILDIPTRIYATQTLYRSSALALEEKQRTTQILSRLTQQPTTSFEEILLLAQTLYRFTLVEADGERLVFQILLDLTRRPGLSFEQTILATLTLYEFSSSGSEEELQAIQIFSEAIQQPDIAFEKTLQVALALYLSDPKNREEMEITNNFLQLKRLGGGLYDQLVHAIRNIQFIESDKRNVMLVHLLLDLSQLPHFSLEQVVQFAQTVNQISLTSFNPQSLAIQMLSGRTNQYSLSFKEYIVTAQIYYLISFPNSDEKQQAIQMLLDMAQRPNLSFEQILLVASSLYQSSEVKSEQEKQAFQILSDWAQQSSLSFEQMLLITQSLCQFSSFESEEKQKALQKLSDLVRQPNLSFEQVILAAQALYWSSPTNSVQEQEVQKMLLNMIQQPNLSFEQIFSIAWTYYIGNELKSSSTAPSVSEQNKIAFKIFSGIAHRSDISLEQKILIAHPFFWVTDINTPERQEAINLIWQLAQEPSLTVDRRIQVGIIPLATNEANYSERAEAVRILLDLVQGEAAKQHLKDSWLTADADKKVDMSDISSLIDLAKQEMLPTEIRNEVYKILWDLVAQFGSVKVDNT